MGSRIRIPDHFSSSLSIVSIAGIKDRSLFTKLGEMTDGNKEAIRRTPGPDQDQSGNPDWN